VLEARAARPWLLLALALLLAPAGAHAQRIDGREALDDDRPEAWAMRWFAAALAPSGFGTVPGAEAGQIEAAVDAVWLPELSERQRTVGFGGTKTEDLNRAPAVARPRVRVALPARFALEGAWLPPVAIDGARANLLSLALARPLLERYRWRLGLRVAATTGTLQGDFTCPADAAAAGADPIGNPYACEAASEDEIDLDDYGAELGFTFRPAATPALELWTTGTLRRTRSSFQTDARYGGLIDRGRLDHSGSDWGLATGLAWRDERWWAGAELRWTPLEVDRAPVGSGGSEDDPLLHGLLTLAYRLR
jgi:hypothetical protein